MLKNRKGHTLIEVMISSVIATMVIGAVVMLMFASLRSWARGSGTAYANADATIAMQKLVLALREAKSVAVSGSTVNAVYPTVNADGTYDASVNGNTISFYLTGNTLYRKRIAPTAGTATALSKYVQSVSYTLGTGNVLAVTLTTAEQVGNQTRNVLIHEKIQLRNAI